MYDIIGDIHGYADELKTILKKLGYKKDEKDIFFHPERKAFFVGDFIDRGPKIPEVLSIVKSMVDKGSAYAVMGNHEYNALCFYHKKADGGHLRSHSIKHILQHCDTLKQFKGKQKEYEKYLEWFLTLPLFYENEYFRVVHACWDDKYINCLKNKLTNNRLNKNILQESATKGTELYNAIEVVLKGKEISLNGLTFKDKDGNERKEIRIKWWINPDGKTYKELSINKIDNFVNEEIIPEDLSSYYNESEKQVFFGHYWLKGNPEPFRNNIICTDYSVADNGKLVAYRWENNKNKIKANNFVLT